MTVTFRAMTTQVSVLVPGVHPRHERELAARIQELFAHAERIFSRFRPESELSRLNAARGPVTVSPELFAALERARAYWELTEGWFDPLIGNALRGAGYDRSFAPGTLDRSAPRLALVASTPRATSEHLVLDPRARTVELPAGAAIDCGGFIKGWVVDRAANLLPAPSAVDAGGDAAMRGAGPDGSGWRVDVEDPTHPGRALLSLYVRDQAVATSGANRRRWRIGGLEAHHLIDPHTGQPGGSDVAQASVVAPSAELADVLAKTVFLRGRRDGQRFLERFSDVSAVLVLRDGRVQTIGELEVSKNAREGAYWTPSARVRPGVRPQV